MEKSKYLRVTFDPETHLKVFQETNHLQVVSDDVFTYLKRLSYLMPDVVGIEQWRSREVGPKVPRYHGHLHEIVFIMNGSGAYVIDGKTFSVKKDDIVLIKPNEVHRYSDESDIDCISLHFSIMNFDGKKRLMKQAETANRQDEFLDFLTAHYPNIHIISAIESSQIFNKARRLFEEFRTPSPGSKLMLSIYFIEILILMARNYLYAKKGDGLIADQVDTRNDIMVRQVLEYLDRNYSKQINLSDIFKNYYMHPNHCRFLFKKTVGCSVSRYILRRRMIEAKRLVLETNLTLQEIGESIGILDYYYFLRTFKKVHGISPGSLRKSPTH